MRQRVFKKASLGYSSALVAVITLSLFFSFRQSLSDLKHFKKPDAVIRAVSAEQHRGAVSKDLWIAEGVGKRLHDKIESHSSTLILTPKKKQLEIVEHLNGVHGTMQERVDQSVQHVRLFDANTGTYEYSTGRLTAQTVSLALFRLPGSDLPSSFSHAIPYLAGVAEDVTFAVTGKASQFQAKQFRATFAEKESLP